MLTPSDSDRCYQAVLTHDLWKSLERGKGLFAVQSEQFQKAQSA